MTVLSRLLSWGCCYCVVDSCEGKMPPSTSSRNRRRGGGRFFNWSSGGTRSHPHSNHSSQLSLYSSRDLINSPLGVLAASPGMAIFINQAMFFLLCDKIFCPRQRLTGLYSLLFYNVASYLISYGKDIIETRKKYTPYVEVSEQSHVRHLAMSATKVKNHSFAIDNYD